MGDIINYDWTNDGSWDHVVIVSQGVTTNEPILVCSHNKDYKDWPWASIKYSYSGYTATNVYDTYYVN